ncbi:triosephosphate isomerase [Candidatus Mesenet endosymbiont of Agriotes lineatus]|uniref:triosephosphate isomerase n=1 Tax=Candidatus Mesenet endosymbiont of Agriotes lineatus TaxID=3077948 RepID=UPI0030CA7A18
MSFLIVANWKMNGSRSSLTSFTHSLNECFQSEKIKLVVCPPFTALPDKIELTPHIKIGAQNCHYEEKGAYTGEISAKMLSDLGCSYVILGHSERKLQCGETDDKIKSKAYASLAAGLHPIICIGETLLEREKEKTEEVLLKQCRDCLPHEEEYKSRYTVAYEPVWAIGQKSIPDISLITETIEIIQPHVRSQIIYGGSVNLTNVEELVHTNKLSGFLIGSASLNFYEFFDIIKKVESLL